MFLLILSIHRVLHRIVGVIVVLNVVYLVRFYDNRLTEKNYGQAFGMLLAIFMIGYLCTYIIACGLVFCARRRPILTIGSILLSSLLLYGLLKHKIDTSCDNWDKGIDNLSINNNVSCKIAIPQDSICYLEFLEGVFDFTGRDCSKLEVDLSIIKSFYPDNPIIGFPRVEKWTPQERQDENFNEAVLKGMVGLNSFDDEQAKDLEVFIDQRDVRNVKIVTQIKRNETLVQERSKLNKNSSVTSNVLVLFFDALSRARIHSKLKKTIDWISQKQDMKRYEFFKYHSVTPFTFYDEMAVQLGLIPDFGKPPPEPYPTFITEYFKNGYITGRSTGYCISSNFNAFSTTLDIYRAFPYDHEGTPLACDPHYTPKVNPNGLFDGPYSISKRCMYKKHMFEHQFEYATQFWTSYSHEKKFFMLEFLDSHEPTQEVIKYMDDPLVKFLSGLDLQDTTVIFWSDHGRHYEFPPYNLNEYNFYQERALPALFLMMPLDVAVPFNKNLEDNTQRLIYGVQIYDLFCGIANGNSSPAIDKSMLKSVINLTCENVMPQYQLCYCN
jgi:hypothetical protein